MIKKSEKAIKGSLTPGSLFEDLGLRYIGPIDGHNLKDLIRTFKTVKELKDLGISVSGHVADLSEKNSAKKLFDSSIEANGEIDILINNVGGNLGFTKEHNICFLAFSKI